MAKSRIAKVLVVDDEEIARKNLDHILQKEGYIVKQLKAFKDGSRKDPMMSPMASPLSDEDMANLAAYFSSL